MIQVGVVMGSNSDWEVMQHAVKILKDFGINYEALVISAPRTPNLMFEYSDIKLILFFLFNNNKS